MPWYCNFFSMRLFKYFFRQFSYKSIQVTIFQVSLKLVEPLLRYGWKKVTRNVTSYFIYKIGFELAVQNKVGALLLPLLCAFPPVHTWLKSPKEYLLCKSNSEIKSFSTWLSTSISFFPSFWQNWLAWSKVDRLKFKE